MAAIVSLVEQNSIAKEIGIEAGDEILSIDEQKIRDLIDYKFLIKSEFLTLLVKKPNGDLEEIELEKDFDDDLGIVFESAVFDKIKSCQNKCIFCFVDQQPSGLRDTLYVKDDDYRLSYLQGTYITLTNLSKDDKKRIETLGLGPLYISLHTTNPELRVDMLNNKNAGKILEHLKWLKKNEIPVHLQIVLCPNYNDGEELKRTLNDLESFKKIILSVAIVPVGLTKFRKEKILEPVSEKVAKETLKIADEFNKKLKKPLVCCSDEFFMLAKELIPSAEYYGNFSQLEDGVGALRLLLDDFEAHKNKLPKKLKTPFDITFATSKLAAPAMRGISLTLNTIENLKTQVVEVNSKYWGDKISVAGLITSDDLISSLKNVKSNIVIIPSVMLKPFSEDFLDGKSLDYVKQKTGLEFLVIGDCYSTLEIVEFIGKIAKK